MVDGDEDAQVKFTNGESYSKSSGFYKDGPTKW